MMAHEVYAAIRLRLEDGEEQAWTASLAVVATQWAAFLAGLEPLRGTTEFSVSQARPKQPPRSRRKADGEGSQPELAVVS
jgi:hypothetical protein